jgi:pyrroloquinoline quinone biosynthesis protein B
MEIRILGSAAGGGFPQWNCNCYNCAGLRQGTLQARPRTQSSIAVSADGLNWMLFNASPDIRTQMLSFSALGPGRAIRGTGMVAVLLMDSQMDHTAGLLTLREGRSLEVYCTDRVHQDLTRHFPLFNLLSHYCDINHHTIPIDGSSFTIPGAADLRLTALPLRSKAPPYSPHRYDSQLGDTIGMHIDDLRTGHKLFYAPGLGEFEAHLRPAMEGSDCLLVDGTFWREDEMIRAGLGKKSAREMGHLPQTGPGGMLEQLRAFPRQRRVLIHINNSNPILDETSPERAILDAEGVEVAFDGMTLSL